MVSDRTRQRRETHYVYDKAYESTPEQKHRRALRNKARRQALREGKVHKGDSKDIHHPHGITGGTEVTSSHHNRSIK